MTVGSAGEVGGGGGAGEGAIDWLAWLNVKWG